MALSLFTTEDGINAYKGYSNLVERASVAFPELPKLLISLTSDFVATAAGFALDGVFTSCCPIEVPPLEFD